jgi:hypothetical protein
MSPDYKKECAETLQKINTNLRERLDAVLAENKALKAELKVSEKAYKSIMRKVHNFGDKVEDHIINWE